jgi:hypothetical protein
MVSTRRRFATLQGERLGGTRVSRNRERASNKIVDWNFEAFLALSARQNRRIRPGSYRLWKAFGKNARKGTRLRKKNGNPTTAK